MSLLYARKRMGFLGRFGLPTFTANVDWPMRSVSSPHAKALGYEPGFSDLLEAQRIRLRVLAPRSFYEFKTRAGRRPYQLDWLGRTLQSATRHLALRIGGGFHMDFGFDVFPDDFISEPEDRRREGDILKMMAGRRPLIDVPGVH